MNLPPHVQRQCWEEAVKTGEAYAANLWKRYPVTPINIRMLFTTTLVRYTHEARLDAISDLPSSQWLSVTEKIEKERMDLISVLVTWIDPLLKQAFDCLSGELAVPESYDRARAYEAELSQAFPYMCNDAAPIKQEVVRFLIETDRRWWQQNYERLPANQPCIDRLRKVNRQILKESVKAMQAADVMAQEFKEDFKGFGQRVAKTSKRHHN